MSKTDHAIHIQVNTTFLPEQSNIDEDQYVFAYHIQITNKGDNAVQLISRHWFITEADDEVHEVKGLGVVGEQPLIQPNETYQYNSHTVLKLPSGKMHGSYQMVAEDGTNFTAEIPAFECTMPRVLH